MPWLNQSLNHIQHDPLISSSHASMILLTPCSPETFQIIYKDQRYPPSCFENLSTNLRRYGVTPDRIPTTFNIFMNVEVGDDGRLSILPPRSRAGRSISLRAELDLIVGLTACSAEMSNNYKFKSIAYEVLGKDVTRPN
jgi:uncharacterized protein YcgI (DUF1989 family)